MSWMRIRLWRVGIADFDDASVQSGRLVWRRWCWRIWTADVMPYWRSLVRKWATWRLGQFLADRALLAGGPVAACDAMQLLNRAAKSVGHHAHEIYQLKRRLIGELLEAFPCRITKHVQEQACYSCDGTGIWSRWASYADTCWKCGGTGVYRSTELLLFAFNVRGHEYRWHQPADFWPHLNVGAPEGKYEPEGQKHTYVGEGLRYETLCETVARWIDAQGLRLDGMHARGRGYRFTWCVRADAKRIVDDVTRAFYARVEGIRRWLELRELRRDFPNAQLAGDDDLPF